MDPASITLTAVGWLMSSLVEKAVTALLEAWEKCTGLGNDFETLKNQLLEHSALLTSARGLPTDNSSLKDLVLDLQQFSRQGLDENAFLSFFSTCIFNDPNYGGNLRSRNIGAQIAKKLKGNPLAAKTMSALLKKNPDERGVGGDTLSSRSSLLHDFNRFSSNYIKYIYREVNLEKCKATGSRDAAREVFLRGIKQMPCNSLIKVLCCLK